ncbi:MAG: hypothetical protein ABIA63_10065 [bacterium]
MNQDQIKKALIKLRPNVPDFFVILSGKASKKVDGLYHPEKMEIIIHSMNHHSDNELMYTAMHEFAHHIQFTGEPVPPSARSHNPRFWKLFHELLSEAENKGIYNNGFENSPELKNLTIKIKQEFLLKGGNVVRDFGRLLLKAKELCETYHIPFEDYITRVLTLPREAATSYLRISAARVDEKLGWDNMKLVSTINDKENRMLAQDDLLSGKSVDQVKVKYKMKPPEHDPVKYLEQEKMRIEKAIKRMVDNLDKVNEKLRVLKFKNKDSA